MLTAADNPASTAGDGVANDATAEARAPSRGRSRLARALRIEWIGQTVASLCWIASVFTYGIEKPGDYLQLAAASAWLVANVAALASEEA
ncbi:MAG: hypothetical protein AAF790_14085 [Planctomycetota bacterium]